MEWKLDKLAFQKACKTLEIKKPVTIYPRKMKDMLGVAHTCWRWDEIIEHTIVIDSQSSLLEASKTIWHELAHCRQIERDGTESIKDYELAVLQYKKRFGDIVDNKAYRAIPQEAEAYAVERKYRRRMLVIPR